MVWDFGAGLGFRDLSLEVGTSGNQVRDIRLEFGI